MASFGPGRALYSGQVVHLRTLSKKLLFMDIVLDAASARPSSSPGDRFELVATHRDGHSIDTIGALARGVCI